MRRVVLLALAFLAVLLMPGCAGLLPQQRGAAPAEDMQERQRARFEAKMLNLRADYHIPGMSVVVLQGTQELFADGFGQARIAEGVPATTITPYRIASLTKPIAATLMMQLVAEGRIDLDAPFAAYDPGYADLCALIRSPTGYAVTDYNCDSTVRHHLAHTTQGTPGDAFEYQGGLYGLLARVVEHASGVGFDQLLRDRIITPLGMTSTAPSQDQASSRLLAALAQPYRVDARGNATPSAYPVIGVDAAAGMVSTVKDLARFSVALDQNVLLTEEAKQMMWTPARANSGQTLPYGLGWFVQEINGTKLVWHFGWWPDAFSSLLVKVPQQDVTFILLANSDGASAPFDLGPGDILKSPFAVAFLQEYTDLEVEAR